MRALTAVALLAVHQSCAQSIQSQSFSLLGLSDSCNKALGQLFVGSPAANCLNTPGLLNVLTTPSGQSWVGPFDNYLTATCSQPACTRDTITSTISSLTTACSTDLAAKNWSPDDVASILTKQSEYYPSTREVMCLRSMDNQNLCITKTLGDMEAMIGQPLNMGTLIAKTPEVMRNHNISIPQNISCTQCTQATYTIARPVLPAESVQGWDNFWIKQCGENFISGTLPASVTQTANQTTETPQPSQNAALVTMVPSLGVMLASLALLFGSSLSVLTFVLRI